MIIIKVIYLTLLSILSRELMNHTLKSHEVLLLVSKYFIRQLDVDSWDMITSEINKAKKKYLKIDLLKMYSRNELKTTITKHFLSVCGANLLSIILNNW